MATLEQALKHYNDYASKKAYDAEVGFFKIRKLPGFKLYTGKFSVQWGQMIHEYSFKLDVSQKTHLAEHIIDEELVNFKEWLEELRVKRHNDSEEEKTLVSADVKVVSAVMNLLKPMGWPMITQKGHDLLIAFCAEMIRTNSNNNDQ